MQTFTTPDGRTFEYMGVEPYRRVNGSWTRLDVWRLHCSREGCTGFREFKVPVGTTRSNNFNLKHCREHAATREQYLANGASALARINSDPTQRRRVLSDADIAEIRKLHAEGLKYAVIALLFPATPGTIREIVKGRRRCATSPNT